MTRSQTDRAYLVTGATGFLGKLLLESLLRRREELGLDRVFALVRPQPGVSAARRFQRGVHSSPCFAALPGDWTRWVEVVESDLAVPGAGLSPEAAEKLCARVTHVVHAAATVDFDLPLVEAASANVTTALHALELARRCPRLEAMVSVSTAYATPHPGDAIPIEERLAPLPLKAHEIYAHALSGSTSEAALLARAGHPNTYTLTKCVAEHLLVEGRGDVPLTIVRPSIISATLRRPFPGWIDSLAAFASFVALIGAGHLRAVVGHPRARLNLVPADWVAEQVIEASGAPAPSDRVRIHHAVAAAHCSPSIAECRERIVHFFRQNPAGRRAAVRYVGPPDLRFRVADLLHNRAPVQLAKLRSSEARRRGGRVLAQIESINRLFPYFTQRSFDFRASRALDAPDFDGGAYVSLVCEGVARHLLRRGRAEPPAATPSAYPAAG